LWKANAPAIGAIVNDSATRKVNMVRPMRMEVLDATDYRSRDLGGQVTISRGLSCVAMN
jgi:hypothetical protein